MGLPRDGEGQGKGMEGKRTSDSTYCGEPLDFRLSYELPQTGRLGPLALPSHLGIK